MDDWKPCSLILSHILDYTGYSGWMIDARKRSYSEKSRQDSQERSKEFSDPRAQFFISGSKGEGLSNFLSSDTDILLFQDHIVGIFEADTNADDENIKEPTRYMFKVERYWSPPGYCMLVLASKPTEPDRLNDTIERSLLNIDNSVVYLQGGKFLQSFFAGYESEEGEKLQPLTGPSQPSTIKGYDDFDYVPTLSSPCSAELDAWYKRPRHHDWPSESLQQDIISTPANVVATGSKEGIFDRFEWRFCFNRAEQKLMHSLNLTQSKVYVVLKMILKEHLKPEKKEITSYVMKNIVFWMCELNPSSSFRPSTLLSWIYVGLQTLKEHIAIGNIPYYMIPARNLLEGKLLDDVSKFTILDKLSKLLESGACLVHVCETIQLGLELYSECMLENYGWKRNLVEMYSLNDKYLPSEIKAKRELLRLEGITNPRAPILLPDEYKLEAQGHTHEEIGKIANYRIGLFLNEEKAEIFAENSECHSCETGKHLTEC